MTPRALSESGGLPSKRGPSENNAPAVFGRLVAKFRAALLVLAVAKFPTRARGPRFALRRKPSGLAQRAVIVSAL